MYLICVSKCTKQQLLYKDFVDSYNDIYVRFVCGIPSLASPEELSCECYSEEKLRQKLVMPAVDDSANFQKSKEEFKRQMNYSGMIYRYLENLSCMLYIVKVKRFSV